MSSGLPSTSALSWKGKKKLTEHGFDPIDLNPPITYRHLLSQNLGARDPLRVIALCDSDAFYATCEMVRLKTPPDTPLVVLQWDSLIAVNYPARKYGISRMDKVKEAKKRCPDLVVVHVATYKEGEREPGYWDDIDTNTHKVSLDYYRKESAKIGVMFKEGLPGCEVEKASIDEAFIDFTLAVRKIILGRFPHLAQVPPDAPHGADTILPPPPPISWDGLGYIIPITPQTPSSAAESAKDNIIGDSEDASPRQDDGLIRKREAVEEETEVNESEDSVTTWHDVALSIAAELMEKVRKDIYEKLGYTTSAGIARNKFLAKLTASYKKPNSQSILRNAAIPKYLRPMPFQKIRFLGGKLGKALAEEFEASAVGDLLSLCLAEELQHKFGEDSLWVYEVLRGIDRAEVKEKSMVNKSMMASKNLPQSITQSSEGFHWIRVLAAELALRLKDARQESPNLWPKTIVLHTRKGSESGRSKQAPFPFTRDITVDVIALAGDKLWKDLIGNGLNVNVTHVALGFTGIDIAESGQQSIEAFLKGDNKGERVKKRPREDEDNSHKKLSTGGEFHSVSYTCTECGKTLTLLLEDGTSQDGDMLGVMQREHEDFHFALELSNAQSRDTEMVVAQQRAKSPRKRSVGMNRKRGQDERKGIERFFTRK
ncbi:hypothetical protein AMATHDRAFT_73645 [Amanita thiersii Skay4041]|uniref:DNA polymerase eta n=1 Tax=Amanita thiersii Skay4041 TaxID=703135 RepID=A0A2A9NSN6_9AGAR|nr:hypothetical protein AMATHDRAFT_73645 [Amanita thiersii Skay4041]